MLPYLVDARPVNAQNGDGVRLYLRENGRSFTRVVKMPHTVPSIRMDRNIAELKIEELRARHPTITFEFKECGKKKAAIWARGPKDVLRESLSGYKYMTHSIGATQLIRWKAPLLSFVSFEGASDAINGDGVKFIPRENIDDLLSEKVMALDLEVKDWRGKGPRAGTIYMASLVTNDPNFGNYVLSTYEAESDVLSINGNVAAKIIYCKNEQELIAKINELISSFDPLILTGANINTYDILKLKETGGFYPGVLGEAPRLEANCGFFKKMGVPGRFVHDIVPWSLTYGYTPNNKLVTVGSCLLNREIKKDLTYEEIDKILEEADPAGITRLIWYCKNDSEYALDIERFIRPHPLHSAMFYGVSPSTICTTGIKNLATGLDNKRQMALMKTVEKGGIDQEFNEFDMDTTKYKMLKKHDPECLNTKRGLFRDAHVICLTPFIHALGRYMNFNKGGETLYNQFMDEKTDPKMRVFVAKSLNGYIEKMVYDLCCMRRVDLSDLSPIHSSFDVTDAELSSDKYFGYKYKINSNWRHHTGGYRPNNFMTVINLICDSIDKTCHALRNAEVINYSDRFLFAKFKDEESLHAITQSGLGVHLYTADVLSSTQGRVLYRTKGGVILSEEMDPTGRKGHRTLLEQEMVPEFGRLIFEDKYKALEYVWDTMKRLAEGKMPREKLIFDTTARMDNDNISSPAMMQERSQMMIKNDVKEGEKLSYGYCKLVKGFPGTDEHGRTYRPGYVGDIIASTFLFELLFDEVLVANDMYLDRMFGKIGKNGRDLSDGTIGDLLISAFPSRSADVRKMLNAVAEGDPNAMDDPAAPGQKMLF